MALCNTLSIRRKGSKRAEKMKVVTVTKQAVYAAMKKMVLEITHPKGVVAH
jgi:hypothetical protein